MLGDGNVAVVAESPRPDQGANGRRRPRIGTGLMHRSGRWGSGERMTDPVAASPAIGEDGAASGAWERYP